MCICNIVCTYVTELSWSLYVSWILGYTATVTSWAFMAQKGCLAGKKVSWNVMFFHQPMGNFHDRFLYQRV